MPSGDPAMNTITYSCDYCGAYVKEKEALVVYRGDDCEIFCSNECWCESDRKKRAHKTRK